MTSPRLGQTYPPQVLTPEEIRAIMAAFSRRGSAGIRNLAITALLYRCGLRINEALSAELGDLQLEQASFYVRHPKRGRDGRAIPRTVGVDAETAALLERWLARRRVLGISTRAGSPLFCQVTAERCGWPMAHTGYREALRAAAAKAGAERRVHPHGLRHTFAFQWVQEGRPLNQLQLALGHRSLATTAHYTDHLNPKEVLDAMRGREWASAGAAATPELAAIVQAVIAQLSAAG